MTGTADDKQTGARKSGGPERKHRQKRPLSDRGTVVGTVFGILSFILALMTFSFPYLQNQLPAELRPPAASTTPSATAPENSPTSVSLREGLEDGWDRTVASFTHPDDKNSLRILLAELNLDPVRWALAGILTAFFVLSGALDRVRAAHVITFVVLTTAFLWFRWPSLSTWGSVANGALILIGLIFGTSMWMTGRGLVPDSDSK